MLDITCQMEEKMDCGTTVACCCEDHTGLLVSGLQRLRIIAVDLNGFSVNPRVAQSFLVSWSDPYSPCHADDGVNEIVFCAHLFFLAPKTVMICFCLKHFVFTFRLIRNML